MKLIVVTPAIEAWMKQTREPSGFGIDGSDVTALEPVADGATQREILRDRLTAVFHCDHVIDLVFRQRELFWNTAILHRDPQLAIVQAPEARPRRRASPAEGASFSCAAAFAIRTRCSRYSYLSHSSSSRGVISPARLFSISSATRADRRAEGRRLRISSGEGSDASSSRTSAAPSKPD